MQKQTQLLELSQQAQCCLLLGNQAGKWLILNTGSCSPAASWGIQERGSCLWPRTSICFSPLGTRQDRSFPQPQQTESSDSPGGSQALGQKHCPGKASPEQADPAAVLLLLRTAMVGIGTSAEPGWNVQLHSSSLPLSDIAATLPGAFTAPSPWQERATQKQRAQNRELPFCVFLQAEKVKGEVFATQPCSTGAHSGHTPGSVTARWTAACSITPAAQPAWGMGPAPTQQVCHGSFCPQGTVQHVTFLRDRQLLAAWEWL